MKPVFKLSLAMSAAIAALALSGCNPGAAAAMAAAAGGADKPYTVAKGDLIVEVVDTGNIAPAKTVEVKSLTGGQITKLYVDEGDVVKEGQVLALVDPRETQLAVNQEKAQLEGARAALTQREIDLQKRRITVTNNIDRMKSKLSQLELQLKNQPTLTSESIDSASTNYQAQQRAYDTLVNITQPNTKVQVENDLTDAKNNELNAKQDWDRKKGLLDKGYVSGKDVDAAELTYNLAISKHKAAEERVNRFAQEQKLERDHQKNLVDQAKADFDKASTNKFQDKSVVEDYKQAKQQLVDAQNDLRDMPSLEAAKKQQQAAIDQLSASVADGERQLSQTSIIAPVSGIIGKRYVQVGELATSLGSFSSGTQIVRIDDRSKLIVNLNINEIDVARMSLGQKATISVDAVPEQPFGGKVTKIAPSEVAATGTDAVVKYAVEITLDSTDQRLKAGMSAKCTVRTVDKPDVVKIPINYLGTDEKGSFVMIAPVDPKADSKDKKSKPTRQDVVTGVKSGTEVEIVSGLKPGAQIVTPKYKGPKRVGMMGGGGGDDDQ